MTTCGAHYGAHPSRPHLTAVCVLPACHDGEHDNALPKRDPLCPHCEMPASQHRDGYCPPVEPVGTEWDQ